MEIKLMLMRARCRGDLSAPSSACATACACACGSPVTVPRHCPKLELAGRWGFCAALVTFNAGHESGFEKMISCTNMCRLGQGRPAPLQNT